MSCGEQYTSNLILITQAYHYEHPYHCVLECEIMQLV